MKKILIRTALASTLILFGACGGSSSSNSSDTNGSTSYASEYPSSVEDNFVSSCTSNGGDESTCQCVFDYIADVTPYEDFTRIEAVINAGGAAEDIDVLTEAADACQ